MSRLNAPRVPGRYKRVGPGQQVCLVCDTRISTNAMAVAGHERGEKHRTAVEKEAARLEERLRGPKVPTRHGDERNRRTVSSGAEPIDVDMWTGKGWAAGTIPGASHAREVVERWCERCHAWILCDGIMGSLAFSFEHEDVPHTLSTRPLPGPIPPQEEPR